MGAKKPIYVVGGHNQVAEWLKDLGFETTDAFEHAEYAMFTGGGDVSPELYGEVKGASHGINVGRDADELDYFTWCLELNIPMIGICRGAQLLTVANGGSLIQDVSGHRAPHEATTINGKDIVVTSTHHQMMYPQKNLQEGEDFIVLAWSKNRLSTYYSGSNKQVFKPVEGFVEPEMVWYPKSKSLAIQFHPEHAIFKEESKKETLAILEECFFNQGKAYTENQRKLEA